MNDSEYSSLILEVPVMKECFQRGLVHCLSPPFFVWLHQYDAFLLLCGALYVRHLGFQGN